VTFLGDLTIPQVFREFHRLYTGKLDGPKMHTVTGRKIRAASDEKVLIDVDGECPGTLPVLVEIVPAALNLISDKRRSFRNNADDARPVSKARI
jgi:diacylglycerol kinase family enzyme